MPKKSFRGLMLPGAVLTARAVLTACAFLSSCALQPSSPEARAAGHGGALRQTDGRYQLDRSFQDFYDTAFVVTGGGKTAPRVADLAQVADTLSAYDVVFYGEHHGHPGVHFQQMKLLRALVERNPRWVLSFEQFERDVQGTVDEYVARRIGETTLIDKGRAWNNYAASYRPLLLFARDHQLPVVAAEAPGWAISCVGQWGPAILDRFTPLERTWVADEVHIAPGAYEDKFMAFLGTSAAHGGGTAGTPESVAKAQRSFAAQVARDGVVGPDAGLARLTRHVDLHHHLQRAGAGAVVAHAAVRDRLSEVQRVERLQARGRGQHLFAPLVINFSLTRNLIGQEVFRNKLLVRVGFVKRTGIKEGISE